MTDIVERAKNSLNIFDHCRAAGVDIASYPERLLRDLMAEVEKLREQLLLPHLYPCVCTRHALTGEVLDYDCGRDIAGGAA